MPPADGPKSEAIAGFTSTMPDRGAMPLGKEGTRVFVQGVGSGSASAALRHGVGAIDARNSCRQNDCRQ